MQDRGARALWLGTFLLMFIARGYEGTSQLRTINRDDFIEGVRDFVADFARINFNMFSKETILVFSLAAPIYVGAYHIDEQIHYGIYDADGHKNLIDVGCCSKPFVEDLGIAIPLVGLAIGCILSDDENTNLTGQTLLSGTLSIGITKDFFKAATEYEICRRPYNGLFEKKRVYGGFPSGHAAVVTYATLLYAFRKGAKWAIPIGLYSGMVMGFMLSCNYHYLSQIVAGMAFGAAYAVAANKVVKMRLQESVELHMGVNKNGGPQLEVAYSF